MILIMILVSLFKIQNFFSKRGLKFNGRMMLVHCCFFTLSYASVIVEGAFSWFFVYVAFGKNMYTYEDELFTSLYYRDISRLCVKFTLLVSIFLIFYVLWQFANQCAFEEA